MGDEIQQHKDHLVRYNRVVTLLHEFNIQMTEMIPSSQDFGWIGDIVYKIFPQAHTISLQFKSDNSEFITQWTDRFPNQGKLIHFTEGHGIAGHVLAEQQVINVPDVITDERYIKGKYTASHHYHSLIVAPLLTNRNILGTLSISALPIAGFDRLDEIYIDMLARQIAVLLHRSELYYQEREQRIFAESLRDTVLSLYQFSLETTNWQNIFQHIKAVISYTTANIILINIAGQAEIIYTDGYLERGVDLHQVNKAVKFKEFHTIQHILKTKKPYRITDTIQNDDWTIQENQTNWIKSYLGVPLLSKQEIIGFISLDSEHTGFFTELHEERLITFSATISQTLEHQQLLITERAQRVFVKKLSEIITRLTNTSNLDNLFDHMLEAINEVIANDGATITLRRGEELVHFAGVSGSILASNPTLKEQVMPWRDFSTWRTMMETRESLLVANIQDSPSWEKQFNIDWVHSYVGAPLVDENQQVIGFINLDSHQSYQFTEQDAERLKIFADHLVTVIQKTQLLDAERKQREIADTLHEIGLIVTSFLKPDDILLAILEHLNRVLEYATASIWFLNDDNLWEEQISKDYEGISFDYLDSHSPEFDLNGIFKIVENSPEIIINSIDDASDGSTHHLPTFKSIALAPIFLREKIIGALVLWHIQPHFYTDYHKPILEALANQLAIAIDNARLYAKQEAVHREIRFYADSLEKLIEERTQELDNERTKLNTILQEIGEGVVVIETMQDGKPLVSFVNQMMCQMLGVPVEEVIGQELASIGERFVPNISYKQLLAQFDIENKPSNKSSVIRDLMIQRSDNTTFEAQASLTMANIENENTWLGILLVRNVSKQRTLQRQRERFLANASHELRTPLTNFNTRFYLMRRQPEKLEAHLDVVERTAEKMATLVNDLLDLMRINRGNDANTLLRYDIRQTLEEVYTIQLAEAELKHIQFDLEIPDNIPKMLINPKHCDQIFTNLVTNAIRYTPIGGQIKIICQMQDDVILISIIDTGTGIPAEFTESIFEPFMRVNVDELGTGLGLAIVKELVESYDGKIWTESEVGKGSVFYVQLPTLQKLINAR